MEFPPSITESEPQNLPFSSLKANRTPATQGGQYPPGEPELGIIRSMDNPVGIPLTRVMSPTLALEQGLSELFRTTDDTMVRFIECPICSSMADEVYTCAGCGRYGHYHCLGAEYFQNFLFCGDCLTGIIGDFARREDAAKREEWKK